jgi:putative ABC transport system permease protein
MRKTLLLKGFRELWAHKIKYIMFIIILALGVSMFNTMFTFMETRELTVDTIYDESQFMDYQIQFQYGTMLDQTEAEDILENSAVRDVIENVEYRLMGDVFINHTISGEKKLTKGKIIGYEYFYSTGQQRAITVNIPLFFDNEPSTFVTEDEKSCYLEVNFANKYDFQKQDILHCSINGKTYDLTIKEVINVPDFFVVRTNDMLFPDPSNLGVFIVPIQTAQEILLGTPANGMITNDIVLTIDNSFQTEEIEEKLIETFESAQIPVNVLDKEDNPARYQIVEDIEGDKQLIGLFPIIIFSVSAIGLFISLRRMVQSHRPQIGVFKALGVPNHIIFLYFFIIGLFIATASILLGYLLTFPLNSVFHGLLNEMMIFAAYEYASITPYFIMSAIITFILCILCTLLPSYKAVREKPVDVIQKQEGLGKTKKQKKKNNIFFTKNLPIPLKIVTRDIQRKPIRSFSTIFGVALALAFFLSIVILADSMLIFLDESKEANAWDYEIGISGFTSSQTRNIWLQNTDYIEEVEFGLRLPLNISKHTNEEEVMMIAISALSNTFNVGVDYVETDGIYISSYIAEALSIKDNEWVKIEIPIVNKNGEYTLKTYTVEVLGIHTNPMGLYVYADIDYIYELTNMNDLANVFYIDTTTGRIPLEVQNKIATTPNVASVTYILDQEKFLDEMFDLMLGMIFLMIIISAVLMLAIIYNISMINASEKNREYATMKTLGTSLCRISYLIFIEGMFTLIGGIIGGSILGYYMAVGMFKTTDLMEGFTFDIILSMQWFLVGVLMVTLVVIIVGLLTIRYITKIVIADVIRERTTG